MSKRATPSRFLGPNPSKAALDIVASLKHYQHPEYLYGEAVADRTKEVWKEHYTQLKRQPCAHGLLNKPGVHWSKYSRGENCYTTGQQCRPPGEDHGTLWKNKKTGERLILIQPYHLDFSNMVALVEWCKQWGLQANIQRACNEYSNWYFPGKAFPIEITKAA